MYKQPTNEPIAIVGSSCRFAGGVTSPSKLWDLISQPTDLTKEVPEERFNSKAFYHENGEYHGTTNSTKAYWLEQDHRVFDSAFFRIPPKEAEATDPQQRLLLEVVYEAMESAGYTLTQHAGQEVGVYAGVMTADYDTLSQRDEKRTSQYFATGNARSIVSNRISYFFDFRGPSMTIDTACSSSLVALDAAVTGLRAGKTSMACVTGVNLMLTPEQFIVESSLHMLSPTGQSRMWDVSADGYARGEGVAAVFLKPLSAALADGDRIECVIRETGVNSDGRTPGITMPNPEAQAALIRRTYQRSGLNPLDPSDMCDYFEAHGTGTQAGDPREAQAINEAFYQNKDTDVDMKNKLIVGSIKTIIGHTEGTAGLAGILKVIELMKHSLITPNLHFENPNPSVVPYLKHLHVPTSVMPWPQVAPGQPRRASVNSFGFGGTNAHAIVESYEPQIHYGFGQQALSSPLAWQYRGPADNYVSETVKSHGGTQLQHLQHQFDEAAEHQQNHLSLPLCLSAGNQKSLQAMLGLYRDYLVQHEPTSINKLALEVFRSRTALGHRVAISARSSAEAIDALNALLDKAASSSTSQEIGMRANISSGGRPKILGVFTGQGAQWPTMSRSLLMTSSVFGGAIQELDQILQACPHPPSWTIEAQILADEGESRMSEAAVSQPVCTAVQLGLVNLLKTLGIGFHTVVGHSSGEIAAAYAAGRLTLRDAILVSYYRGKFAYLAGGPKGEKGGMLAAGLSENQAIEFCANPDFKGRICVAASNAPQSVTLSGDLDVIHLAKEKLEKPGKDQVSIFARPLKVDTAYHSDHMHGPAVEYVKALERCGIAPLAKGNGTSWISSVDCCTKTAEMSLGAGYWRDNMVQPVQFHDAVKNALSVHGSYDCAVEIGPHAALEGPVTQTTKDLGSSLPYYGTLNRKKDDSIAFSDLLGFIWSQFGPLAVDFNAYVGQSSNPGIVDSKLLDLPSYPWDHSQIHFRESRLSKQFHHTPAAPHELLGTRTRDDNEHEMRWRNILTSEHLPWLEHHRFQGLALLPASAYCVMAVDAARAYLDIKGKVASIIELEDLQILSGITIEPESAGTEVLSSMTFTFEGQDRNSQSVVEALVTLTSCPADGSTAMKKNMSGTLRVILGDPDEMALPLRDAAQAETLGADPDAFYKMMDDTGLVYSGPFKALETIERRYNYSSTTLKRVHPEDTTSLRVSPASLDASLQSAFLSYASPGDKSLWTGFLPVKMDRIRFNIATCDVPRSAQLELTTTVDTHLMEAKPTSPESKASFTVDIGIFNQRGETEIQVEGLTVEAVAHTTAKADHELYQHTVMDLDPTDEIIQASFDLSLENDLMLTESCERVASYYLQRNAEDDLGALVFGLPEQPNSTTGVTGSTRWPSDNDESIERFINTSPYQSALELIRTSGETLPSLLNAIMPMVISEAHHAFRFSRHIGRVVKQISHRFARMNVLSLGNNEYGLEKQILQGLDTSFISLTIGNTGREGTEDITAGLSESLKRKVSTCSVDLNEEIEGQFAELSSSPFDLVLLSTAILEDDRANDMLKNVRAMMRPGAFLVLVQNVQSTLQKKIQRIGQGRKRNQVLPSTPPEWPDVLETHGFIQTARNSHQFYAPSCAMFVRQVGNSALNALCQPCKPAFNMVSQHLLIIGGNKGADPLLASRLHYGLFRYCEAITVSPSFAEVDAQTASSCTSIMVLSDLEESVMMDMSDACMDRIRVLLRPNMSVLWMTCNARYGNPEHAATLGFTRTISAEIPNLRLQVLDLEDVNASEQTIAETYMRFCTLDADVASTGDEMLWTHEPEIYMEDGKRMVPRIFPMKPLNERFNAVRRTVSNPVNTLETATELTALTLQDTSVRYEAKPCDMASNCSSQTAPGYVRIMVYYSSLDAMRLSPRFAAHVCIGKNMATGQHVVALSSSNASYITVPAFQVYNLGPETKADLFLLQVLVRYIAADSLINMAEGQEVLMIGADAPFTEYTTELGSLHNVPITSFSPSVEPGQPQCRLLHPKSTHRQIRGIFPAFGANVLDLLPENNELSRRVIDELPENCVYQCRYDLLSLKSSNSFTQPTPSCLRPFFQTAIPLALQQTLSSTPAHHSLFLDSTLSIPSITTTTFSPSRHPRPFTLLDWQSVREVQTPTSPFLAQPCSQSTLLSANKTYILVGLTRDLGQSLARLFLANGARNLVLASRNPFSNSSSFAWTDELSSSHGARIVIERLDVTSLSATRAFKARLGQDHGLPPVGGVVNGAMVLDDRVFGQMDAGTWSRVMRPKTVGSRNLDVVFDGKRGNEGEKKSAAPTVDGLLDGREAMFGGEVGADGDVTMGGQDDDDRQDLEFFIMTSSFAAIGGHPGQSNYAAANNYMNGMAAKRRAEGRCGSVLNIGVVYGLGFLQREKSDLYAGLEREGYPPISERDLHHMFLEAIVAGKPPSAAVSASGIKPKSKGEVEGQPYHIITGLSRYDPDGANPLNWHLDPRFSHFTNDNEDDDGMTGNDSKANKQDLKETIAGLPADRDVVAGAIAGPFCERLAVLLHLQGTVGHDLALEELGIDSLIAVEIMQWFSRTIGREVAVMKILGTGSILKLCLDIADQILADRTKTAAMTTPTAAMVKKMTSFSLGRRGDRDSGIAASDTTSSSVTTPISSPIQTPLILSAEDAPTHKETIPKIR